MASTIFGVLMVMALLGGLTSYLPSPEECKETKPCEKVIRHE